MADPGWAHAFRGRSAFEHDQALELIAGPSILLARDLSVSFLFSPGACPGENWSPWDVSRGLLGGLDDCPVWAIVGETMRAEEDGSFEIAIETLCLSIAVVQSPFAGL